MPASRPGVPRPTLDLNFPMSLGLFEKYEEAQRAVDYLSDEEFPVQNCMIVGTDLKQVERVTGRLTYARAAMAGAATGAWMGVFVGVLLSLFSTSESAFGIVIAGVLFLVWRWRTSSSSSVWMASRSFSSCDNAR